MHVRKLLLNSPKLSLETFKTESKVRKIAIKFLEYPCEKVGLHGFTRKTYSNIPISFYKNYDPHK